MQFQHCGILTPLSVHSDREEVRKSHAGVWYTIVQPQLCKTHNSVLRVLSWWVFPVRLILICQGSHFSHNDCRYTGYKCPPLHPNFNLHSAAMTSPPNHPGDGRLLHQWGPTSSGQSAEPSWWQLGWYCGSGPMLWVLTQVLEKTVKNITSGWLYSRFTFLLLIKSKKENNTKDTTNITIENRSPGATETGCHWHGAISQDPELKWLSVKFRNDLKILQFTLKKPQIAWLLHPSLSSIFHLLISSSSN